MSIEQEHALVERAYNRAREVIEMRGGESVLMGRAGSDVTLFDTALELIEADRINFDEAEIKVEIVLACSYAKILICRARKAQIRGVN